MLSAIVLAAGESRRMGSPKALLSLGTGTFIETICSRLFEARLDEIVVVLGAHADEVRRAARLPGVRVVVNEEYGLGQLSSLQRGLGGIDSRSEGALVTLVDHPLVEAATYRALREEWEGSPEKIVVARFREKGGHPVIFPRALFGELMDASLEVGARAVLRKDARRVRWVGFDDFGIVADIDSPEDYEKFVRMDISTTDVTTDEHAPKGPLRGMNTGDADNE
ncbi:MAG: nucleotidyltransferase family protein [bacterium]